MNIAMGANVYIGLSLTSHNASATCEAKFSNVSTTGTIDSDSNLDCAVDITNSR